MVAAVQVALGGSQLTEARELATRALAAGERAGVGVVCQALFVLGRIARRGDLAAAEELFERAQTLAEGAGLAVCAALRVGVTAFPPCDPRPTCGSRITGDFHVRFYESRGVRLPPATHLICRAGLSSGHGEAAPQMASGVPPL